MVTASHNPADYNGLKLVREDGKPISADTGLLDIEALTLARRVPAGTAQGSRASASTSSRDFVEHLLVIRRRPALAPLKVVVNAGNGGAGRVIDALEPHLPFRFVKVHHEPDGRFPNGIPNPLLTERRDDTARAVRGGGRGRGNRVGRRLRSLLLLRREAAASSRGTTSSGCSRRRCSSSPRERKIVHDPRLTWNTIEIVREMGGVPVQSKSGHAFMKEVMRREDAAYGGEMSAHHFFREFAYCDSGMIPVAARARDHEPHRQAAERARCGAHAALSDERGDQPEGRRCHCGHREDPRALRALSAPRSTRPTASAWTSRSGASTCGCRTPSRSIRLNVESRRRCGADEGKDGRAARGDRRRGAAASGGARSGQPLGQRRLKREFGITTSNPASRAAAKAASSTWLPNATSLRRRRRGLPPWRPRP